MLVFRFGEVVEQDYYFNFRNLVSRIHRLVAIGKLSQSSLSLVV